MNRVVALFLMPLMTLASPVLAQRADSAATARRLVASARSSLAGGDSSTALGSLLAATRAWPDQGAYRVMAARLAAATGHDAEALALLAALNADSYGWNTRAAEYASLEGDPVFRALADSALAKQRPLLRSTVHRVLPDERLHPEAVAFDPGSGRVFVTSVRQRKVIVLQPDGRVADFVDGGGLPLDAVLGAVVDTARQRLWLTSSPMPEAEGESSGAAAVVAVDLRNGVPLGRWEVPDDGQSHLLGEVTLAPDGGVYATDSRHPAIYRVPDPDRSGTLTEAPFHSADWVSLQGLTFAADGELAWVADWTTGLFRIDIRSGTVGPVAGSSRDYLLGIDDLLLASDGGLVAIQNGIVPPRVILLALGEQGDTVTSLTVLDRHLPEATEPSGGALVAGALLYVANAPWGHYLPDGRPDPANPFPKPVLLWLPL